MTTVQADAKPEKRLFISLLTRDIPLVAAFLDLLDNSVNAAIEPFSARLKTASDYQRVFDDDTVLPNVSVELNITTTQVSIVDKASGISASVAASHVFKFGRDDNENHENDRLSVYGIGLKRAIFKLGNRIKMRSEHVDGGFDLDLRVSDWAKDTRQPWTFAITKRKPVSIDKTGTKIVVTELYDDVTRRLNDGMFNSQLREAISKTYAFYLAKFVRVSVNNQEISPVSNDLRSNYASDSFSSGGVTCSISAGIGTAQGGAYRDKSSGWFVFCNGRAVISADKSPLTGWATPTNGLPIFQPKHRPFLGNVFFVSENAELLPWTTTKSAINEDSGIWQKAKRQMATVGRVVISFLDGRYTDEGTEVASVDLQMIGGEPVSALRASTSQKRTFEVPKSRPASTTMKIQYDAQIDQVKSIASYLKNPSMSGSDVGRYTFIHFLRNEVGQK